MRLRRYIAAHRRLVTRLRADRAHLRQDLADAQADASRFAARCRDLGHQVDQLTTTAADCPRHTALEARLAHLQAVTSSMDAPIGLDITAEEWCTAVTALATELAARQRKGQDAA